MNVVEIFPCYACGSVGRAVNLPGIGVLCRPCLEVAILLLDEPPEDCDARSMDQDCYLPGSGDCLDVTDVPSSVGMFCKWTP